MTLSLALFLFLLSLISPVDTGTPLAVSAPLINCKGLFDMGHSAQFVYSLASLGLVLWNARGLTWPSF